MPARTTKTRRRTAVLPVAASLVLLAGAAPASAEDQTYSVELRQELPRTATSSKGGVPQEGRDGCPGVPEGKDGWHFVLPGNSSEFVELTVTFEPGGQQVITDFGPPTGKHAYAASEPGAQLVDVAAEVEGGSLELFNLSHTCPSESSPTTPPGDEPTDEPTDEPSEEPSQEPTDAPAPEESEDSADTSEPTPSEEPSSTPAPAGDSAEGETDGDLAATGAGPAIGGIAAGAAALLGAGGYLVLRRRKAAARQG